MADESNFDMPESPEQTPPDKRIDPASSKIDRAEREANKLAHKGIKHEHEFDNLQKPFTK
jgi:hypothetical protein